MKSEYAIKEITCYTGDVTHDFGCYEMDSLFKSIDKCCSSTLFSSCVLQVYYKVTATLLHLSVGNSSGWVAEALLVVLNDRLSAVDLLRIRHSCCQVFCIFFTNKNFQVIRAFHSKVEKCLAILLSCKSLGSSLTFFLGTHILYLYLKLWKIPPAEKLDSSFWTRSHPTSDFGSVLANLYVSVWIHFVAFISKGFGSGSPFSTCAIFFLVLGA